MARKISDFTSAIGVGARSNLFEVSYSSENGLGSVASDFSFLTKAAALPNSTVGLIEVPFRGRRLKLAGDRVYNEWTATVINDESFAIRAALESLQDTFVKFDFDNDLSGNRSAARNSVTIKQFGQGSTAAQGGTAAPNVVRQYTLQNCFISEIGTIDLSYDTTDAIEEYTVTWVYEYFTADV